MPNLNLKLTAATTIAVATLVASCASGPSIHSDYDKAADFSKYHTYGFVAPADTDSRDYKSLTTQIVQRQAAREMELRGYSRSATPDLVINFRGQVEEKVDVESVPGPYYGPGWGYHGWYGAPYGGWGGQEVTTHRYNVGTLVMDVVDREKRQMVYQGSVQDVVSKQMMENREATLTTAVQHIFSKYPFVAGQAAPVAAPAKK